MARKAKQRISYVLPLANQRDGHRLGVNGLAADSNNSILYTGGRDGLLCAWDLNIGLRNTTTPEHDAKLPTSPATVFRSQVQAHTHWINDIALAKSNQALISASSDVTVKLWRPDAADGQSPQPIGLHSDFVKRLAVPSATSDWVASGGLDGKVNVWDLNGAGQKLSIRCPDDDAVQAKGSIYALGATNNIIASGGPESTVRVWDARTGRSITKLVGHTDILRDVLISYDGDKILTASSDKTVKVWSTVAGRCMYTLTMHDASVWSLFSSHPDLSVFYSSDRSGLIAKTDTRNTTELDDGLSVALAQESEGVFRVVAAGDCVWTATSRPSINRWRDVNTDNAEIEVPDNFNTKRASTATTRVRVPSPPSPKENALPNREMSTSKPKRKIPLKHMLRLSNNAYFPTPAGVETDRRVSLIERRGSKQDVHSSDAVIVQPVRGQADFAIEGQNGLIKHVMLKDRKRVLTLDTAGEVVMWDLLKCVPIKSFGRRHLDDVEKEVATDITVTNWCTVDTRTGNVAVILDEGSCFDAEMYADELDLDDDVEFKDDQRINLGKWVLRYLFSNLITEEIRRDQAFRKQLLATQDEKKLQRENAPNSIQLPQINGWHTDDSAGADGATTPRAAAKPRTPGLGIGLASPLPNNISSPTKASAGVNPLSRTAEEGAPLDPNNKPRESYERSTDYFSTPVTNTELMSPGGANKAPTTPNESAVADDAPTTPLGETTPKETPTSKFGKKFTMRGMSFSGMKKIGRSATNDAKEKPVVAEKKEEDTEDDEGSTQTSNSRNVDDNLLGTVQKMRFAYEDSIQHQIQSQQAHENGLPVPAIQNIDVPSSINPALPAETPILNPPLNTTILIQEDRPEAGGVADLFEGTVGSLGRQCELVEKAAPMWLGDFLLKNQVVNKETVKISFILEPAQGSGLPSIASDGNNRLNANRLLRAKKILGYVAERIEPAPEPGKEEEGDKLRPEEYLELYCNDQLVPPKMTLATIRSHLWKGGADVTFYYKSNGRKEIRHVPQQASNVPTSPKPAAAAE